jgi:hypothetical protein
MKKEIDSWKQPKTESVSGIGEISNEINEE